MVGDAEGSQRIVNHQVQMHGKKDKLHHDRDERTGGSESIGPVSSL